MVSDTLCIEQCSHSASAAVSWLGVGPTSTRWRIWRRSICTLKHPRGAGMKPAIPAQPDPIPGAEETNGGKPPPAKRGRWAHAFDGSEEELEPACASAGEEYLTTIPSTRGLHSEHSSQEDDFRASHPAAVAFLLAESALLRAMAGDESGGNAPSIIPATLGSWIWCFEGCPVQPAAHCMDLLTTLVQLSGEEQPAPFCILHCLSKPLYSSLATASRGDLRRMQEVADYLQLPKRLTARCMQHAAARELSAAGISSVHLRSALEGSLILRPLFDAALAAVPALQGGLPDKRAVATFLQTWTESGDDEVLSRADQLQMQAEPSFLDGLCGAPFNDTDTHPRAFHYHLTGLIVAGHDSRAVSSGTMVDPKVPLLAACAVDDADAFRRLRCGSLRGAATAARCGSLRVLSAMWEKGRFAPATSTACLVAAATAGRLDVLQWYRGRNQSVDPTTVALALPYACQGGHLAVAEWLHSEGAEFDEDGLAWACLSGQQPVVEWALGHGCERGDHECTAAALRGHLPLLRWLRGQGFDCDSDACVAAASGGHVHVLQFLREQGREWGTGAVVCEAAARSGHLDCLTWCLENGAAMDARTPDAAARGGHLEVLQFAHRRGSVLHRATAEAAVKSRSEECLEYILAKCPDLRSHSSIIHEAVSEYDSSSMSCRFVSAILELGCKIDDADVPAVFWAVGTEGSLGAVQECMRRAMAHNLQREVSEHMCGAAAGQGRLAVLELAAKSGCFQAKHGAEAVAAAVESGRVNMLHWLVAHGCIVGSAQCITIALSGDRQLLSWVFSMLPASKTEELCIAAADSGSTDLLEWLMEQGCPAGARTFDAATIPMKRWLCLLPGRDFGQQLWQWAIRNEDKDTLDWALEHEPGAREALHKGGCIEALTQTTEMLRAVVERGARWAPGAAAAAVRRGLAHLRVCTELSMPLDEAAFLAAAAMPASSVSSGTPPVPATKKPSAEDLVAKQTILDLLVKHDCPWSPAVYVASLRAPTTTADIMQTMRALRAYGCPADATVCAAGARISAECFERLRLAGFPFDDSACVAAAEAGQLEVLQLLADLKAPLSACAGLQLASEEVRLWLWRQGVESRPKSEV